MSGQQDPESKKLSPCSVCKEPTTKKCSACKLVYFCNQECLRRGWGTHKLKCGPNGRATLTVQYKQEAELYKGKPIKTVIRVFVCVQVLNRLSLLYTTLLYTTLNR
jgi:hypothetical protein